MHFGGFSEKGERQKFCVHGIIGARQTGASNEHTNTKRNSRKKFCNPLDSHIEQYVSELRASGRPLGAEAFSEAVRTFSQRFVEAMLQGEMDAHLTGCQPTETPPEEVDADELSLVPNKRNGFSHKTLKTEFGPLPLSVPRDRRNTFDPIIVPSTAGRSARWTSRSSPCTPGAHEHPRHPGVHRQPLRCGHQPRLR